MAIILVPHHHPQKEGATEHVQAIVAAFEKKQPGDDIVIAAPVANHYSQTETGASILDIADQVRAVKGAYPGTEHKFLVLTGDYGADAAPVFKSHLGEQTQILMSSYTFGLPDIVNGFGQGVIDYLAVPAHAVERQVLSETSFNLVQAQQDRIISTVAVPHTLDSAKLAAKYEEWQQAAAADKLQSLPAPHRDVAIVVMPGDIEGPDGKPVFFSADEARELADAVYQNASQRMSGDAPVVFLVSNGPRTGKYNQELVDDPNYAINDPRFHHADRMRDISRNPVATAFLDQLTMRAGEENIVNGCIMAGKTPPQGFLAFYHHASLVSAHGASVAVYVDGVSTTMLGQAANVVAPDVPVIALDSSAKNATHIAGVETMYAAGVVEILGKTDHGYILRQNEGGQKALFDDAMHVADTVTSKIIPRMYLNKSPGAWSAARMSRDHLREPPKPGQ